VAKVIGKFIGSNKYENAGKGPDIATELTMRLVHEDSGAIFQLKDSGEELEKPVVFLASLKDGVVPEGFGVLRNDEILPAGSRYVWEASSGRRNCDYYAYGEIEILNDDTIDLTPREPEAPLPEPAPVVPPLPAKRIRGAKYSGFVATDVYGLSGDSTSSVAIGEDSHEFYLPYRAVVRAASIVIVVPQPRSILVELYSYDHDKTLRSAVIDASKRGRAVAYFDKAVILNQGEHRLSWRVNTHSSELRVHSIGNSNLPKIRFSV
jgi:hypothetical protein